MSAATLKTIGRRAIKIASGAVNIAVLITFLLMLAFGGYALWDSNNVASSAEAKQYEVFKPTADDGLSFAELQAINPEVFGWLTLYGTPIDYPLVQAENNSKYINTSVEGEYSLTGAIFLDYTNDKSFKDFNSIIYGHNMVPQVMFGGIKEFKTKDYFDSHKYGSLYYDGKEHGFELFAMLEADGYDDNIYSPGIEGEDSQQRYLDNLLENAMYTRNVGVSIEDRIVLLSTCSDIATNGRDILIGRITDEIYKDEFITVEPEKEIMRIDSQGGQSFWSILPLWVWIIILVLIALVIAAVVYITVTNRRKKDGPHHG